MAQKFTPPDLGQNLDHATKSPGRLDDASRRVVQGLASRACLLTGFAFIPWVIGLTPFSVSFGNLFLVFSIASTVTMVAAVLRREHAGHGSLNGWDEAMALNALALLVHAVCRAHPHP